jgi:hypothetical protein
VTEVSGYEYARPRNLLTSNFQIRYPSLAAPWWRRLDGMRLRIRAHAFATVRVSNNDSPSTDRGHANAVTYALANKRITL